MHCRSIVGIVLEVGLRAKCMTAMVQQRRMGRAAEAYVQAMMWAHTQFC